MRFALLEAKLAIVKALRVVEIQRCEKTEVRHLWYMYLLSLPITVVSRCLFDWGNYSFSPVRKVSGSASLADLNEL